MKILNLNCRGHRRRPVKEFLSNCIRSNNLDLIVLQETHLPKMCAEECVCVFDRGWWCGQDVEAVGASSGILISWNVNSSIV